MSNAPGGRGGNVADPRQDAAARSSQTHSAQTHSAQTHSGQTHSGETHSGQTHSGETRSGQTHAGESHAAADPALDPTPPDTVAVKAAMHDLNNLMTAIIGLADEARARPGLESETHEDLRAIGDAARRGSALTRVADAASRRSPVGAPPEAALGAMINQTARLLIRAARPVPLRLQPPAPGPIVRLAPEVLDRMLLNLVINAREAVLARGDDRDVGTIDLRTEALCLTAPRDGLPDRVPPGDYAVIVVTDEGVGIAPGALASLLRPGTTTRAGRGGSGLGLASVRASIAEAGGFLVIAGEAGRGTRVEIWLPTAGARDPASPTLLPTSSRRRTAVAVDDEPLLRRLLERTLSRAGWTVHSFSSADSALGFLAGNRCDLVISDVELTGLSGTELAHRMVAERPGLPVILTSGYAFPAQATPLGRIAFLTKPFDQDALLSLIAELLPGDA